MYTYICITVTHVYVYVSHMCAYNNTIVYTCIYMYGWVHICVYDVSVYYTVYAATVYTGDCTAIYDNNWANMITNTM